MKDSGDSGFDIVFEDNKIGYIGRESVPEPEAKYKEDTAVSGGLTSGYAIHSEGSGKYSHVYSFSYTDGEDMSQSLSLAVDYEQLDDWAATRISGQAVLDSPKNAISGDFTLKNGSKDILIIGNSFIGTSRVGEILGAMLDEGKTGYTANSWPAGSRISLSTNNTELMNAIRGGSYCAVFLCGFYEAETEALGIMKAACDSSDTMLSMFPAHNEQQPVIGAALMNFPDLSIINWKSEINSLIDSGISTRDMCINDAHQHSTAVAGYVGAHMIYRTLFGKLPPEISGTFGNYNMTEVYSILGNYPSTGSVDTEQDIPMYNF